MKIYLYFLGLTILTSCALVLGIKDPKPKSINELNSYLKKKRIDTLNCFAFKKKYFDSIQKKPFKPNWPNGFRPIQFKAFNKQGKLVSQYSSCEGSWKKNKIFDSYPPKNLWPLDSNSLYSDDIKMYTSYYGKNVVMPEADLNIIIYWASWLGVINKNLLKEVYTYKLKNSDKKINIIKVNVDEIYSPIN